MNCIKEVIEVTRVYEVDSLRKFRKLRSIADRRWLTLSDLIIAIDLSEDGPRVIALVGAREHIIKTSRFIKSLSRLRHVREVGSDRKSRYISLIPKRIQRVKEILEIVRICRDLACVENTLKQLSPLVVLVDDKLYSYIKHPRKVKESSIKETHRKKLMLLADNLANYFRILLKSDPKRFREELKRFEK